MEHQDIFKYQVAPPTNPPPARKTYTPEAEVDMETLKQRAILGEGIDGYSAEVYGRLVNELKQQRDFLISLGLFSDSEAADRALQRAVDLLQSQTKVFAQKNQQNSVRQRLNIAHKELQDLQRVIDFQETNMKTQFEGKRTNLREKQENERKKLDEEWSSDVKMRRYNRTSNLLRTLRAQSIRLLNDHRYEEMRVIEKKADDLEREETDNMRLQMQHDYAKSLEKLLEQHEIQKEELERTIQVKTNEYEAAKLFDLTKLKQRIANIENNLRASADADKVWNAKKRFYRPPPAQTSRSIQTAKTGRREIKVSDFNTLSLPPLREPRTSHSQRIKIQPRTKRF